MVTSDNQSQNDDARAALDAIESISDSVQKYAAPPHWFIAFTAIIIFIVFVGIQQEGPNGLAPLIIIAFVRIYMERTKGLMPLLSKKSQWKTTGNIFLITCAYLLAVYLFRIQELSWAPLVAGTITASIYAIRAESARSKILSED